MSISGNSSELRYALSNMQNVCCILIFIWCTTEYPVVMRMEKLDIVMSTRTSDTCHEIILVGFQQLAMLKQIIHHFYKYFE